MSPIDFQPLDKQVALEWLMKRNYSYYSIQASFLIIAFSISLFLITLGNNIWIVIANTIFFGFVRLQAGFFAHDLSHLQVFKSKNKNLLWASIIWAVFCWLSASWWEDKHNAHHRNTNQLELDPDVNIPFIFDQKQLPSCSLLYKKCIVPFQQYLFFPAMFGTFISEFIACCIWTVKNINTKIVIEWMMILSSIVWLFVFSSLYLSWYNVLIFWLWHLLIAGMYMGIAFSPNHYGEEIIETWKQYLREYQIRTSRNISGKAITSFFLWGLNYQIEHHLYPTMPRINLGKVRKHVKEFSKKHTLRYHEVNIFVSFMEIFLALRKISKTKTPLPIPTEIPVPNIWFSKDL